VIGSKQISVSLKRHPLESNVRGATAQQPREENATTSEDVGDLITLSLPIRVGRRGRETRVILQSGRTQRRPIDQSLVTMIARGYVWRHQIASGEAGSMIEIARREKVTDSYVSRIVNLGFLAPDIIATILEGTAPAELTANRLQSLRDLPLDWPSQRPILGFSPAG
jgi:site-specific DNA recombinase